MEMNRNPVPFSPHHLKEKNALPSAVNDPREEEDEHECESVQQEYRRVDSRQIQFVLLVSGTILGVLSPTMNQCTFRSGVESSHSRNGGPKPAKNGL